VIFAIGDKVEDGFGLPVKWNQFVKNPNPRYPIDGVSHELINPDTNQILEGIFVAGWSREASSGLVGVARKDGENGAKAILQYLQTIPVLLDAGSVLEDVQKLLEKLEKPVITKDHVQRLESVEQAEAERRMLEEFKFGTNEEMLAAMGFTLNPA
jgi:ferredoxin--NADP+ reductase